MTGRLVVGKREIAELLGVASGTAKKWGTRGVLPAPDHPPVNREDSWTLERIRVWAVDTGRATEREVEGWS